VPQWATSDRPVRDGTLTIVGLSRIVAADACTGRVRRN